MKKTISILTSVFMLTTACTQHTAEKANAPAPQTTPRGGKAVGSQKNKVEADFENLVHLLDAKYPHLGIAEYVAQALKNENPEFYKSLRGEENGLQGLSTQLSAERQVQFENFLYGPSPVAINKAFTASMIGGADVDQTSFHNHIQLQKVSLAQSAALNRIFDIFNEQLEKGTASIAREMIDDLAKRKPEAISELDAVLTQDVRFQAKLILEILKKYDRVLAKYQFAKEDAIKLVMYGLVAGHLGNILKENKTVTSILRAVEKVQDIQKKIREVQLTIAAMDQYRLDMKKNWEDVSSSFKAMKNDLDFYNSQMLKPDLGDGSKAAVANLIHDVFTGQFDEKADADKKSFLNAEYPLDKNLKTFIDSSAKAASGFDNMVASISVLTKTLNVEIPEEVQNVINTAQQISAGVKLGSVIVRAFSSGGLMGVASSLATGGPAGALLSAGLAGQDGNAVALAAIKQDLKEIKIMQKETLELQRSSIKMIRELALMVDEYHKESLYKMDEIYGEVLAAKGLIQVAAEQGLRSCQAVLFFSLNGLAVDAQNGPVNRSFISIKEVPYIQQELRTNISSLSDIGKKILSSSHGDWERCQSFMSASFAGEQEGSLLYAKYAYAAGGNSGSAVEKILFKPALQLLRDQSNGHWLKDMALNFPVDSVRNLVGQKNKYIFSKISGESDSKSLDSLLAPESLERYVSTLLSVHNLIAINPEAWLEPKENMDLASKRSGVWLESALQRVNVAIAQEAILSGEPLLSVLALNWQGILADQSKCTVGDTQGRYCFVRQNTLMMKNLLMYLINQNGNKMAGTWEQRQATYEKQLPQILGIRPERLGQESGRTYLYLTELKEKGLKVEVPGAYEAAIGKIKYSEEMLKLVEMQNMLAAELAKLKIKGQGRAKDLAKLLVIESL